MLNNLKIGVRLSIGFGVSLLLLIVMALVAGVSITGLEKDIKLMADDRFPKTVQANEVIDSINLAARAIRNAALFSGAEQQKEFDSILEQRKIITATLEKLDAGITSDKGRELLKRITVARNALASSLVGPQSTNCISGQARASSMMSGGNDFIAKPFHSMELAVKAIIHILRGKIATPK